MTIIPVTGDHDTTPFVAAGPEFFPGSFGISDDRRIGEFKYRAGRAVILFKFEYFHRGEMPLEHEDVFNLSTAPPVNTLVVIPDGENPLMTAGKQLDQEQLCGIGVLIFVDQNVFEPLLIRLEDFRMFTKQNHGIHQQIVEIHCLLFTQRLLIGGIDTHQFLFGKSDRASMRLFRRDATVFKP